MLEITIACENNAGLIDTLLRELHLNGQATWNGAESVTIVALEYTSEHKKLIDELIALAWEGQIEHFRVS